MKSNKNVLLAAIILAAYLMTRTKVVEPLPDTPVYPIPDGLTVAERRDAIQYYAQQKSLGWNDKLQKMTEMEILQLYAYIFEVILLGKRVSEAMRHRVNLIKYKYQIAI